jgi:hypothetical protein
VTHKTTLGVDHGRVRFGQGNNWRVVGAGEKATYPVEPVITSDPRLTIPSLRAYYRFAEGKGAVVKDLSSSGIDLTIPNQNAITWNTDGLVLKSETALMAGNNSQALIDACLAAGALSIEADITVPGPPPFSTSNDGPARIITLSESSSERNQTLGWGEIGITEPALVLRIRQGDQQSARAKGHFNGTPAHWIPVTPRGRLHVVVTYQMGVGTLWYVNGREVPSRSWDYATKTAKESNGPLRDRSPQARLALGGEVEPDPNDGGLRPWLGTYHLVALYSAALTPQQALELTAPK